MKYYSVRLQPYFLFPGRPPGLIHFNSSETSSASVLQTPRARKEMRVPGLSKTQALQNISR